MNILPKKSWHVRTKANIDRVRRDEAKALEEEKEAERRTLLAQQEARTAYLREKVGLDGKEKCKQEQPTFIPKEESPWSSNSHINFFQDLEDGKKTFSGGNVDYIEEKKKEQEKLEKNIGLLTYLCEPTTDKPNVKPWEEVSKRPVRLHDSEVLKEEVSIKSKSFLDPMKDLRQYTDKPVASKKPRTIQFIGSTHVGEKSCEEQKPTKPHKHKKHNKKKKRHRHSWPGTDSRNSSDDEQHKKRKCGVASNSEKNASVISSNTKSLAELRQERLQRELVERKKSELLLAKLRGEPIASEAPKQTYTQKYNSQFNPQLARQNI